MNSIFASKEILKFSCFQLISFTLVFLFSSLRLKTVRLLGPSFFYMMPHLMELERSCLKIDGQFRPVAFASCTLTPAQQNYYQLEKEAFSITFGLKRFDSISIVAPLQF